ncbi:MAG: hypothetical protein VXZ52_02555 [Candidatus Thermoplasmatota archaeon]|nr:hypothetical protein [Candidatus Thermoplasmatota archaeon]
MTGLSFADTLSEGIAYLGMILILSAFFLETRDLVDSKNWIYLIMMALGSGLLSIRAWLIDEWAFLVLEVVWCLAALSALYKTTKKPKLVNQHIHE